MASETPPKHTSAIRSSFSRMDHRACPTLRAGPPRINLPDSARPQLFHRVCGFDALGVVTTRLKCLENLVGVGVIARLDGDVEFRTLGGYVEEKPPVLDPKNVRAELAEQRGNRPEHAGAIGDGQTERHDTLAALELAHHDRGEDTRIDIATAQDQADLAAEKTI